LPVIIFLYLYSVGGRLLGSEVGRNIIELLSALASDNSTSLGVLGFFHQTELGELLEDVSIDLTGTEGKVVWSTTESLSTTENLSQSANTDVWSDVNSASDSSSTSVHPVSIIRSEFLESSGLDDINPLRNDYMTNLIYFDNVPLESRTCLGSSSAWHMPQ
jgi:hypothetical protein